MSEQVKRRAEQHGLSRRGMPEYQAWRNIKYRCGNPHSDQYRKYGARGIRVCERWRDSFLAFLADMGSRPPGTTIDRIDGTKGYEPGNCRWATQEQQAANRSVTRWVEWRGERLPLLEACRRVGMKYQTVYNRMWRNGWTFQQSIGKVAATRGRHVSAKVAR